MYVCLLLILSNKLDLNQETRFTIVQFDTDQCSSNQFDTNTDQISIKKFKKLFDLYRNYSFPDRSNSAKIYVVRYSSKNLKFDVYCKYSNLIGNIQTRWLQLSISKFWILFTYVNIRTRWLQLSNSMAIIIKFNKKLR